MSFCSTAARLAAMLGLCVLPLAAAPGSAGEPAWPAASRTARPWSYWWWMGSAVDEANLARELQDFQKAGWGGVHIIPIYGAKGFEARYVDYLSPRWMELLAFTVKEAGRLGLGVDMTTGSGWCFGGPNITGDLAGQSVQMKTFDLVAGAHLSEALPQTGLRKVVGVGPGPVVDLTPHVTPKGSLDWTPPSGTWKIYALSTRPTVKVKRAAPGAGGYMINPFYGLALNTFLEPFTRAFENYQGGKPRAMYHDSYEYSSDWSPDLLDEFAHRRGYRLEDELPAFFGSTGDRTARVKGDYRVTLDELLLEHVTRPWVEWSHQHGFVTRNEAHGSPGNLLDLYAAADIPETEMFNRDRSSLVTKFASSAAHVAGRTLVASETGTWLKEHFQETLADMKELVDQLFLGGVNHVIYHGTAYSPSDAPWPGWLFYASTEMNSRNPIWHDVPALNAYIARAQSLLQEGRAGNDVLVYWPVSDVWHDARGMALPMTVHHRDWLESQPVGKLARRLLDRGYSFDFISDRQLAGALDPEYRAIVVPRTSHMPVETMARLGVLARGGMTVVFEGAMPDDVPGLARIEERRAELRRLAAEMKDKVRIGDVEVALTASSVRREALVDVPGLSYLRRRSNDGDPFYFIANRSEKAFDGWIRLAAMPADASSKDLLLMDPPLLMDAMTGEIGTAQVRDGEVLIQLEPGASVFVRSGRAGARPWRYKEWSGAPVPLTGDWTVTFLEGGPELPVAFHASKLESWTVNGEAAERFAGTARYSLRFDAPATGADEWWIDLGRVAESARVRLNGRDLGVLVAPPYRVRAGELKPRSNLLEVEVTNLAANRIRDLDRRHVEWRVFHDANVVNLAYQPFDASAWPSRDSGLLGPVTLRPAAIHKGIPRLKESVR